MDGFLAQVAADLWARHGDGIERLTMVFPSRRARLFFGDALAKIVDRPMWQPADTQIDTLAEELSGLKAGERLRMVVELWKIYAEFHPRETFDDFYFWGELLIGDFDAVDKYLIDADVLFSNLVDLHALDARFDYFSDDQRALIEKFWGAFGRRKTDEAAEKRNAGERGERNIGESENETFDDRDGENLSAEQADFLRVWRTLAPVYHRFRARLRELGIGYQGMIYREAAEKIERGQAPQLADNQYVIVGFNALSRSERVIFEHLRRTAGAEFFWDWDNYFLERPEQEAAMFMRDNLERFPPAGTLAGGHANFLKTKQLRSISVASDVLGCKWAGRRLEELARELEASETDAEMCDTKPRELGKETAVVLCDETLLEPLLWSLPADIQRVNVTMGYPLRLHPAYTFVERLIELQARRKVAKNGRVAFYHSDVDGLLAHPYLARTQNETNAKAETKVRKSKRVYVSAEKLRGTAATGTTAGEKGYAEQLAEKGYAEQLAEKVFAAPDGWRQMSDYLRVTIETAAERNPEAEEVFGLIGDHIRALAEAIETCEIDPETKTYTALLRRSLQKTTLPFEGEPLQGVQVMGILETRALDFENVIVLSAGDATMPGDLGGAPSFIPYNLKMAYGLPTPEHHEGVWAYHFFRLLHRAKNVDLVWAKTTDDRGVGEVSRYVRQLDYESPHLVDYQEVTVDVTLTPTPPIVVEKELEKIPRKMSPSLFWTWRECPMKFYFRAVARLSVEDEVSEQVDGALFGNILHDAMRRLYAPLIGLSGARERVSELIGSEVVEAAVREAIEELAPMEDGGAMLLMESTLRRYIDHHILPFDARQQVDFVIENIEHWVEKELDGVAFFGRVDRIDRLPDGTRRVIDYKTGSPVGPAVEAAAFQVGMYAWMLPDAAEGALYYVREMPNTINIVDTTINIVDEMSEMLAEIFDPAVPFMQTDERKRCDYCDFRAVCGR